MAVTAVNRAVGAGRKLVEYFKRNTVANAAPKKKQEQMKEPVHELLQDVTT